MKMKRISVFITILMISLVLVLVAIPTVAAKGKPSKPGIGVSPNYKATFAGDVTGTDVLVEVKGYFTDISSNVAVNDVELTFSDEFGEFQGIHSGYLHMECSSKVDTTIEIFYTYGSEDGLFYHLHGFGDFEGNKKACWFTINTAGYEFTLSKSVVGEWIPVWIGEPSFTVTGEKL